MSMKSVINEKFGPGKFDRIVEAPAVQHGEPGRTVTLFKGHTKHVFFFADDRKITDQHALVIIASYLVDPIHPNEYLVEQS